MSESFDFERYWLGKFARQLETRLSAREQAEILRGSETFTMDTPREAVIDWSQQAMLRLEQLLPAEELHELMLACACHYPPENLQSIREAYEASGGDLRAAHQLLQQQFETFLDANFPLTPEQREFVVSRGWGMAGTLEEDGTIIATKIPKSGYLIEYLNESDPQRRREMYCHCPRVRDAIRLGKPLSASYCYCGAGFYQAMWEEITQHPVAVEVAKSILMGDEVCQFRLRVTE
ncbi:MAG: hypothetical protein JW750_04275 [Anaerolineaceae bacterium]|nr:hypothetical protein [Anaerolineaceae bacterium]